MDINLPCKGLIMSSIHCRSVEVNSRGYLSCKREYPFCLHDGEYCRILPPIKGREKQYSLTCVVILLL